MASPDGSGFTNEQRLGDRALEVDWIGHSMTGRTLYIADCDSEKPSITDAKAFADEEGADRWFAYPRWTKDEKGNSLVPSERKLPGAPSTDRAGGVSAIEWSGECLAQRELLSVVCR